jgi:Amt family ammonium transporter
MVEPAGALPGEAETTLSDSRAQFVGSLVVCVATFASAMAMFKALNAVNLLRVSKEGEMLGLDIDQHGISAYPEYQVAPWAAPGGMSPSS